MNALHTTLLGGLLAASLFLLGCDGWRWSPAPPDDDDSASGDLELTLLRPAPSETPAAGGVTVRVHVAGARWLVQVLADGRALGVAADAAGSTFEGELSLSEGMHELVVFAEAVDGRTVTQRWSLDVGPLSGDDDDSGEVLEPGDDDSGG